MPVTLATVTQALQRAPLRIAPPVGVRRAAVAAVLTHDLDVLFLRRSEFEGDPWSGHVAFPGGRVEAGETPLQAALRETDEELGLDLTQAELLGPLDELRTVGNLPGLIIHPFVFALPALPTLRLNEEVASVHTVGLETLLRNEGRGSMTHPFRGERLVLPRVDFDGVRLWGLTLHMVDDLLHRLDGGGRGLQRARVQGATPWDGAA